MRTTAFLLSLLLVCSCGGGGGGFQPAPAGGDEGDPLPLEQPDLLLEQTRSILESCTLAELAGFVELLEIFQGAGEEGTEPPSFDVTGFSLQDASVDWTVDLDLDEEADVSGTVAFQDAEGKPTLPFDPLDVIGTEFDVPSLIGAIEDGTRVVVTYALLRGVDTSGALAFIVNGGLPSAMSGDLLVDATDCLISAEFEAMEFDPELGPYPIGDADVSVEGKDATLDGTVSFDSTSVVAIDVGLPDEKSYDFTYDLLTGELTPPGT